MAFEWVRKKNYFVLVGKKQEWDNIRNFPKKSFKLGNKWNNTYAFLSYVLLFGNKAYKFFLLKIKTFKIWRKHVFHSQI